MPTMTLDHIDNIVYDRDTHPLENPNALGFLSQGICSLAETTRKYESEIPEGITAFLLGSQKSQLVACYFHWFAISINNYLRLIKLIDIMPQKGWTINDLKLEANRRILKTECNAYIKKVIPE